jgi:hypothetical protein
MNQQRPAIEQFIERAERVLNEYFTPHKYSNLANASMLASLFPTDSFMPSDQMFVTEARLRIASGQIRETADWTEVFREFHAVTQGAYSLECNLPILEKALQGRKPTPELLVQIASENVSKLVMTAGAAAQAERGARHEALFNELAPRLLTDVAPGSNRYALQLENKRIEERRQQMWDLSLEELEALKTKKTLRSMSKEELKAIVNSAEPARAQKLFHGDRHSSAEPQHVLDLRAKGAEEVRTGRYAQIPSMWTVPGKEVQLDWSFGLLNQLPKEMVKRLIEKFGDSQITAACHTTRFKLLAKQQGS